MSDSLNIEGKVCHVGETETFGSGFQKRLFVIEVDDNGYKNQYGFEFMKDKCGMLDGISVGDEVSVAYNLGRIREYEGKWYSNPHQCWKVSKITAPAAGNPTDETSERPPLDDDDDVPF